MVSETVASGELEDRSGTQLAFISGLSRVGIQPAAVMKKRIFFWLALILILRARNGVYTVALFKEFGSRVGHTFYWTEGAGPQMRESVAALDLGLLLAIAAAELAGKSRDLERARKLFEAAIKLDEQNTSAKLGLRRIAQPLTHKQDSAAEGSL